MKNKIQTYIELHIDSVTLSINVTKSLKKQKNRLKNFGWIKISDGTIGEKELFWDNLSFFFTVSEKKFRKECGEELEKRGYDTIEIYRIIKVLIKRAFKLNILT